MKTNVTTTTTATTTTAPETMTLIDRITNGKTTPTGALTYYRPMKSDLPNVDGIWDGYKRACNKLITDLDALMLDKTPSPSKTVKTLDAFTAALNSAYGFNIPADKLANTFADVMYMWTAAHKINKTSAEHTNPQTAVAQYLYAHIHGETMTEMLKNSDFAKEHKQAEKILVNINDMLTRKKKSKPLTNSLTRLTSEFAGHYTADEIKEIHDKIAAYRERETSAENADTPTTPTPKSNIEIIHKDSDKAKEYHAKETYNDIVTA